MTASIRSTATAVFEAIAFGYSPSDAIEMIVPHVRVWGRPLSAVEREHVEEIVAARDPRAPLGSQREGCSRTGFQTEPRVADAPVAPDGPQPASTFPSATFEERARSIRAARSMGCRWTAHAMAKLEDDMGFDAREAVASLAEADRDALRRFFDLCGDDDLAARVDQCRREIEPDDALVARLLAAAGRL